MRRKQHHAVDLPVDQTAHLVDLPGFISVRVAQEQDAALSYGHVLDAANEVRIAGVRDIGDQDPDCPRAPGSKRLRRRRCAITKPIGDLLDETACLIKDVALSSQRIRNRPQGNSCFTRHVADGGSHDG